MKRVFNIIFTLVVAGLALTSCNDWLDDVEQTSKVSDEIVWEQESSVDAYINSFYTYLHHYGQFGTTQYQGNLTEALTDTFNYGGSSLGARFGHAYYLMTTPDAITADGSCMYSIWENGGAYGHIRRFNQFLELQKKYSKFPETMNIRWEAQTRFFRAFVYFNLAKRHDGVIIYDALPTDGQRDRSTAEETWDFIAKDLDFAAENLPEEWDAANEGRVTKGAALALKSRAMLYAACQCDDDAEKQTSYWQAAYDAADAVEDLQLYDLVSDYKESWKGGNAESILEYNYDKNNGPSHSFDKYYVPLCDGYDYGGLGTPTQEMVECYETKDGKKVDWTPWHTTTNVTPPYDQLEPRFHATIIYRGSTWKGKKMDCSVGGTNGEWIKYGKENPTTYGKTTTGYFLRKLLDESLIDVTNVDSSQPWVEIRFAEVLLNKAEAAMHLPAKKGEAITLINRVRERVGLPAKSYSNDETLFADYRNERKVELSYEGHLFWDMRRWKLAHIEYNHYRTHGFKINGANNTYEYIECDLDDRLFDEKYYILPIPYSERQNNLSIDQYPSWL